MSSDIKFQLTSALRFSVLPVAIQLAGVFLAVVGHGSQQSGIEG